METTQEVKRARSELAKKIMLSISIKGSTHNNCSMCNLTYCRGKLRTEVGFVCRHQYEMARA